MYQDNQETLYTNTTLQETSFHFITVEELTKVNQTLQWLKLQKAQALTLNRAIKEYEEKITAQENLNLPPQTFFTVNFVVDPTTGASLEHPQLKLGDQAKIGLKAFRTKLDVSPEVYTHR